MRQQRTQRIAYGGVLAVLATVLVACTATPAAPAASAGGSTIAISLINDDTGSAGQAGTPIEQGFKFALDQANAAGELGTAKVVLNAVDTGSTVAQATALQTQANQSSAVGVVFSALSAEALALAPIAQRAQVPWIAIQSGAADLTLTGDYVFRATAPQSSYHYLQSQYLNEQGVKRVAIEYDPGSPTLTELGEKTYPALAPKDGYTIVSSDTIPISKVDYSDVVTKIMGENVDAVLALGSNGPIGFISALRQAGYKGIIAASASTSGLALKSIGEAANGVIYPIDFSADTPVPSGMKFVQEFKKVNPDVDVTNYQAEGYDAGRLLLAGIKNAGTSVTRASLKDGLTKAAQDGFDGACGHLTFVDRDARVPGLLVEWNNGATRIIKVGQG